MFYLVLWYNNKKIQYPFINVKSIFRYIKVKLVFKLFKVIKAIISSMSCTLHIVDFYGETL